jgi:hypothetical protein
VRLDLQFELHTGEGADHALDPATLLGEILHRSCVS